MLLPLAAQPNDGISRQQADDILNELRQIRQLLERQTKPAQPPAPAPEPATDASEEATLLARFGDRKFLRGMIRIFQTDSAKALARIREAIAQQDAEALRSSAHALKGSAANFLAKAAVEAAYLLEVMGREQTLGGAEAGCRRLEAEIATLTQSLSAMGRRRR